MAAVIARTRVPVRAVILALRVQGSIRVTVVKSQPVLLSTRSRADLYS